MKKHYSIYSITAPPTGHPSQQKRKQFHVVNVTPYRRLLHLIKPCHKFLLFLLKREIPFDLVPKSSGLGHFFEGIKLA